jgi:hypothetical protein
VADGNWTCIPASHAAFTSAGVDLVVLSDSLVADPRMVRDLHNRGVPHLPVRVRDGTGLVGLPRLLLTEVTKRPQADACAQPGEVE